MITEALFFGLVLSLLTSVLILASLAHHPRIWLGDAPAAMQAAVPPLSAAEKRLRALWGIPIIFSMLGLLPLIAVWRNQVYDFTYLEGFFFLWSGWMLFNLVDLLIIDWLIIVWWRPAWTQLPDVAHLAHLNSYDFHYKAFLKGCGLVTIWAAAAATLFLWL